MTIQDSPQDLADLRRAVALLESPTITARLANLVGSPLELALKKMPDVVTRQINAAVHAALEKSSQVALWSLGKGPQKRSAILAHKVAAAASGAVGGAFGMSALFVELPISTTIIMRAVADIAREEGFDLQALQTKQACIEVFALGGRSSADDASETGYYVARSFTAEAMRGLSQELAAIAAKKAAGAAVHMSPQQAGRWMARLIEKVASRFGVVVTQKFAAQAVPVIGAVSGATINTLFTSYYQDMARGHFIVKRLENRYGHEAVKQAYQALALERR
ncbi:EcsC family protein [Orrella sp. JC864]|uniref:EcsC family protein n=1 Tax=Orrella sp. JC864 TaxID=3120298 RepID=UPI0012BBA8FB